MRLIEKIWFQGHQAKWFVIPLLIPLTVLFWLLSLLRRLFYSCGVFQSFTVTKPVIVVGNIGVGGNGKTPLVLFLVEQCRQQGLTPGVIRRGYGGKAPNYPYLVNERSTTKEAGDEPILIYQRCQVPVCLGSDRVASAKKLIDQGCDIIITDDGLQHYRLARDIEIIVVDGKRRFGNGFLLPAGPLREGKWRLNKADFVVLNAIKEKAGNTQAFVDDEQYNDKQLSMTLFAKVVCNLVSGEQVALSQFIKVNKKVNAIAGIGDPQRFFTTLENNNFVLENQVGFVDHHEFERDDFAAFTIEHPLLMTEKDAVKCQSFAESNWWYLPVDAEFSKTDTKAFTDKINQVINSNS